jgi:hypothetical protein
MNSTKVRKRLLYASEALAIALAMVIGLYPSLLTLVALLSVPALILAIIGVARPAYLDPQGVADPRGWYRKYMHFCAAICAAFVVLLVGNIAIHAHRSAPESLPNQPLQQTNAGTPRSTVA